MVSAHPSIASGLHWLRGEIDQSLLRARSAVEQFHEEPGDPLPLHSAAGELHQVRGAAAMLDCAGAVLLADEMERVLRDLAQGGARDTESVCAALLGAVVQLGDYIDAMAVGHEDCALVLQPVINELRLASSQPVLPEPELFARQMATVEMRLPEAPGRQPGQAQAAARKYLPHLQQALVPWLRGGAEARTSLERMRRVAELVTVATTLPPVYMLWRTLAGTTEALLDGAVEATLEVKRLIGRTAQQAKLLAEQGEPAVAAQAPDLTHQLLFHIGRSNAAGPRATFLRRVYKLDWRLPSQEAVDALRQRVRGPTTALLTRLAEEIRADLTEVKDVVDLVVRAGPRAPQDLDQTLERMRRISDTLGMLGLDQLQHVIGNQRERLAGEGGSAESNPPLWMDAATALLRVEYSLDQALFGQLRHVADAGEPKPQYEEETPHSADVLESTRALLRELLVNLSNLKSRVDRFIRTGDKDGLDDGVRLLGEVQSGLRILDRTRAADLVAELARIISGPEFLQLRDDTAQASRFADAVACIEYYLESCQERRPGADDILDDLSAYVERVAQEEEGDAAALPQEAAPPVAEITTAPPAQADEVDPEIREVFLDEAQEVLRTLEGNLAAWKRDPEDTERLLEIRRAFHTLKGSGRMVGAGAIGEFGWACENVLNRCRDGALAVTPPIIDLVDQAVGLLPALVDSFRDGTDPSPEVAALVERAQHLATVKPHVQEPDMLAVFREDATGHLDRLQALLTGQAKQEQSDVDDEVIRSLHTLRGGAAVVEASAINQLSGALEAYLDSVRAAGMQLQRPALDLLGEAVAELRTWLEQVGTAHAPSNVEDWLQRIRAMQNAVPEEAQRAATDRQLADVFAMEALELVQQIEATARAWSQQPDAPYHARTLKSLFQSLRGAATAAQCAAVGNVAAAFEARMMEFGADGTAPAPGFFDQLLRLIEAIFQQLDAFREGRLQDDGAELAARVYQLQGRAPAVAPVVESAAPHAGVVADADLGAPLEEGERDPELVDIFLAEAVELLDTVDAANAHWQRDGGAAPEELGRALYTLKGSARMAGFAGLGTVAERMHTLVATGDAHATPPRVDAAARSFVVALQRIRAGEEPDLQPLYDALEGGAATATDADIQAGPEEWDQHAEVGEPDTESDVETIELAGDNLRTQEPAAPAAPALMPPVVNADLVEVFRAEFTELLESLDAQLASWQAAPTDVSSMRDMQRTLHTLKGGARMAGLMVVGTAAHDMEARVDTVERAGGIPDQAAFSALQFELEALQRMQDQLDRGDLWPLVQAEAPARDAEPEPAAVPVPPSAAVDDAMSAAGDLDAVPAKEAPDREPPLWNPELFWRPKDDREGLLALRRELARVPVETLNSLLNQAGEIAIMRSRLEQHNTSFAFQLEEMADTIARVREQLRMLDMETEAQIAARGYRHMEGEEQDRYEEQFDPLEMDRYSRMQELSRALSEAISDLSSLHMSMGESTSEEQALLEQQGRLGTEVQQGLMGTLMVPFARQTPRLQRTLQQVAAEFGKKAELEFAGAESEMDRNVLERMTPALEHLVRNAVVHGIEPPQQRIENGKPEIGRVSIRLRREGTHVVIELADDGGGLNYDAIRATAIARGLMPVGVELADEQVGQFIFEAGFTTTQELTEAAGRGVGTDVVAAEVKQLGGSMELHSERGAGTRFTIRLPLTLAIAPALLIGVGHENYAVPLSTIEGIARVPVGQLPDMYREGGPPLQYGDEPYTVHYLGDFVGAAQPDHEDVRTLPALLVRVGEGAAERRMALVVDALHGNREVVSKSVGPQVSAIPGVTGATIMPDGSVMVILDLPALVQDRLRRAVIAEAGMPEVAPLPTDDRLTIMVVDDSITMRRVAERLLSRNGFRVVTARDGLDAMAELQTEHPAAILLDIEMPRADGFEVAAFVRNSERLHEVPIIIITSRSGEKHRQRAQRLGVNRYLIKPYQEDQLLAEIREVLVVH